MTMRRIQIALMAFCFFCLMQCQSGQPGESFPNPDEFAHPSNQFKGHAGFGMMLDEVNEEIAREQIRYYHNYGFGGVFISANKGHAGKLPRWYVEQGKPFMRLGYKGIEYLDEEYIKVYRAYLD